MLFFFNSIFFLFINNLDVNKLKFKGDNMEYLVLTDIKETRSGEAVLENNKDVIGVITHHGTFHADEVTAIALLKVFHPKASNMLIKRIPHQGDVDEVAQNLKAAGTTEVFILDIGRKFNPTELRFDHHQWGRGDSMYGKSSAGLVYEYLKTIGYIDRYADKKLSPIIASVDANDIGERPAQPGELADIVAYYNSDDPYNSEVQNQAFLDAVMMVVKYFSGIKTETDKILNAKNVLFSAKRVKEDKRILELPEYVPFWQHAIHALHDMEDVDIVIWYEPKTDEWKAQVVPDAPDSFGKRGRKLSRVTPYPKGVKFIHTAEFFAVADSKDALLDYIRKYAE